MMKPTDAGNTLYGEKIYKHTIKINPIVTES